MSLRRDDLSVDPTIYAALSEAAEQHGVRVVTLPNQIVTLRIMGGPRTPAP